MTVTATQSSGTGAAPGILLRVYVITGAQPAASQTGAAVNQRVLNSNTWTQSITTTAGSNVYGAAALDASGHTLTGSNATIVDTFSDVTNSETYGTWHALNVTAGATARGFTTSGTPSGPMAQLEILASGTLAEDASAPGSQPFTNTSANPATVSSGSFTPVGGSLLVALVASDGGTGVTTITVSGGGLTWTQKAVNHPSGGDYAGIWIADVPAAAGAAPFTPPQRRQGRDARRRRGPSSSPGAPVTPHVAPFTLPGQERGRARPPRGRAASSPGAPVTPQIAPFTLPGQAKGTPRARRGQSAAGSSPPTVPVIAIAPFTLPGQAKGTGRARRGQSASSSGAPVTVPVIAIAPFTLPGQAKGTGRARRARSAASSGAPVIAGPPPVILHPAPAPGVDAKPQLKKLIYLGLLELSPW